VSPHHKGDNAEVSTESVTCFFFSSRKLLVAFLETVVAASAIVGSIPSMTNDGEPAAKKVRLAMAKKAAKRKKVKKKATNQTVVRKSGKGKGVTTEYRVSKVTGMRQREITSAGKKETITEYELWWVGYPKSSWEIESNVNEAGKSNLQCQSLSFLFASTPS